MKAAKPLLEDKLVTWKRAYEAVLAELWRDHYGDGRDGDNGDAARLRAAAARTAAVLIQGVEHGND